MSTVRATPQQSAVPYTAGLSCVLVLVFASAVSFWAGPGWSQASEGSQTAGVASEITLGALKATRAVDDLKNSSNETTSANVHIYFLLDRSGSMQRIAPDVIKGFNTFVKDQQTSSPDDETALTMSLIQFDSESPHEIVFSRREIAKVTPLTSATFQPRSMTPLYDALGSTIRTAESASVSNERIVVVIFSDGLENASREHSQKSIFDEITAKRNAGWTFVFLGANQDSYAEGGGLGFVGANTQNFAFDGVGTQRACEDVSRATSSMRSNLKKESMYAGKWYDNEDFFEGLKTADADHTSRWSSLMR